MRAEACAALMFAALMAGQSDAAAAPGGRCDNARAEALAGHAAPADADARAATGAVVVRRIRPGQAVTMEFSADRLTLEIADGRVVSARCG